MRIATLLAASLTLGSCVGTGAKTPAPDPVPGLDGGIPARCAHPSEGCECSASTEFGMPCQLEPVAQAGETICRLGVRSCRGGRWSGCEQIEEIPARMLLESDRAHGLVPERGAELGGAAASLITGPVRCSDCERRCFHSDDEPGPEDLVPPRADDLSFDPNDNGVVIDGTLTLCIDASCQATTTNGPTSGMPWLPTADNSDRVLVDSTDGALVLGYPEGESIWIASQNDGTVSRLDPTTGAEIARYPSTRPDASNDARPWDEYCNWLNEGNCPSRTAVDQQLDAYVANRAFGNQGTITKIAGRRSACRDRDGDGMIETSSDVNGDGQIDLTDPNEFIGPDDECILWTRPVGPRDGVPRGLAIGTTSVGGLVGDVWVGLFQSSQVCRVSPATGATLGCIPVPGYRPYGAASTADGRVWFVNRAISRTPLFYVDPVTFTAHAGSLTPGFVAPYGIAVWSSPDRARSYVYLADSDQSALWRYDTNTALWLYRPFWIPMTPRGIAASENHVWTAIYTDNSNWLGNCSRAILRLNTDLGSNITLPLTDPNRPTLFTAPSALCFTGVGVTYDESVWAVAQGSNSAARLSSDRTTWIETDPIFVSPYTYSDFTGYGLNVFAEPSGHYQFVIDSGATCDQFRWEDLSWDVDMPAGTEVTFYARSAASEAGLGTAAWVGPFTNLAVGNLAAAPGPIAPGRYLEIDIRMRTQNRTMTPRVRNVAATGRCDRVLRLPEGSYERVYDTTASCSAGERPDWGDLTWEVDTPAGTSIDFEIRAAPNPADLATATPYIISIPGATSPVDLSAFLMTQNAQLGLAAMSITAVLTPSADRFRTPILYRYGVDYTCLPAE